MNSELFFQKMQPYFQNGVAREIYRSATECIISFGEICYVACPFVEFGLDDNPIGIYMNEEVMKEVINNPGYIYTIAEIVLSDLETNKKLFFNFSIENMENIDKWIKENRAKSQIDPALEAEIAQMGSQGELQERNQKIQAQLQKEQKEQKKCHSVFRKFLNRFKK